MKRKTWFLGLMPFLALLLMLSTSTFAARQSGEPGRVEIFGVVSKVEPNTGSLTITVDKASKDLQDKFGRDVTFHSGKDSQVSTCSTMGEPNGMTTCWQQLAQNTNRRAGTANMGAPRTELNQLKNGDQVFVSGHYDKSSGRYEADNILKWTS